MAIEKATHRGHCQVCSALQKLPEGKLSTHGYKVEQRGFGGWFSGVCRGSHHLPYERDKTLVEESIAKAISLAGLKRSHRANVLSKQADPAKCMVHHYGRYFGYVWVEVEILPGGHEDKPGFHPRYSYLGEMQVIRNCFKDLQDCADHYRDRYAEHLEREAEKLDNYVAFQRKRLMTWTPNAPLMPIGKGE